MKIITRGEAMRIHQQHPASRLFPFCRFNPSQPHHTCFHFYLLSSEVSHYENHHPW
ncbi:DUF987 family protein [Escherichia coli]|uniref:DUF987 family protein n=1 Tax=Escherichia coli TaxID=562 RepID=UPI003D9E2B60